MLLKSQCTTTAALVVDTYKQMRISNSSHAGEPFAHFHPQFVGKSNYKTPIATKALLAPPGAKTPFGPITLTNQKPCFG